MDNRKKKPKKNKSKKKMMLSSAEAFLLSMKVASKNINKQDPNIISSNVAPPKNIKNKILRYTGELYGSKFDKYLEDMISTNNNKIYIISKKIPLKIFDDLSYDKSLDKIKLKQSASQFRSCLPKKGENIFIYRDCFHFDLEALKFKDKNKELSDFKNNMIAFTSLSDACLFAWKLYKYIGMNENCQYVIAELPLNQKKIESKKLCGNMIIFDLDNKDLFQSRVVDKLSQLRSIILLEDICSFKPQMWVDMLKQICACDEVRVEFGNAIMRNSDTLVMRDKERFDYMNKMLELLMGLKSNVDKLQVKFYSNINIIPKIYTDVAQIKNKLINNLLNAFATGSSGNCISCLDKLIKRLDAIDNYQYSNNEIVKDVYKSFFENNRNFIPEIRNKCQGLLDILSQSVPQCIKVPESPSFNKFKK